MVSSAAWACIVKLRSDDDAPQSDPLVSDGLKSISVGSCFAMRSSAITCEKESEVRSENDSEEEETHVHVVGSLDDQTENVYGVHCGKIMSSLELLVREDPFNDDVQVIARALATEDVNVGVLRVPHHLPLLLQSHRRNGP